MCSINIDNTKESYIQVLQANHGDALILHCNKSDKRGVIVIDGGPSPNPRFNPFIKKICERLSPPTTNAFLVESTILFALLLQLVALHCTPLHTIAHHCKLGKIFLLKRLKHKKIPKVVDKPSGFFVYFV